jgi:quercetin dioxygenase-like cupin family protein
VNAGETIDLGEGESILIRRSTAETNGELLEVEARYRPGRRPPPVHYHPLQEERFHVESGAVNALVDGTQRVLTAGETLLVPPGTHHTFWNAGAEEAVVRWEIRPALGTEAQFRELGAASAGPAAPLRMALVIAGHPNEFRLAKPPWPVQRAVFLPLRVLGGPFRPKAPDQPVRDRR